DARIPGGSFAGGARRHALHVEDHLPRVIGQPDSGRQEMNMQQSACRAIAFFQSALLLMAAATVLADPGAPAEIDWQPYVIDHDNSEGTPVDVSFLLGTEPAGASGF